MKIGSVEVTKNEEVLVLPRTSGDIVFRAVSVDMGEWEKVDPEPKAPTIRTQKGVKPDVDDVTYKELVNQRDERRLSYLIVASLVPSEVEWSEVDLEKPNTWNKWKEEFQEAGFSTVEVNRIVTCVLCANSLDEDKIKEARDSFLLGLAQ